MDTFPRVPPQECPSPTLASCSVCSDGLRCNTAAGLDLFAMAPECGSLCALSTIPETNRRMKRVWQTELWKEGLV